jgi:FAD/FMN-containing dehydrogenase
VDDIVDVNGTWRNFSGLIEARPRSVARPEGESEIVDLMRTTDGPVRVVGTGHSCTALCATEGTLVNLDRTAGIASTDIAARAAQIHAGSKIHDLGEPLRRAGLATINQGDIDVQSLAGAISTGTHGTGRTLRNMSSAVRAMRIVLASGEVLECTETREREIFEVARVSLGVLGIVSRVELQLMPAYNLHQREWKDDAGVLDRWDALSDANRHMECFWAPGVDVFFMKTLNSTEQASSDLPGRKGERIGASHEIFPSIREDRFNEMEYSVPAERGVECFREIREMMQSHHPDVVWPVEIRNLAEDNIPLSTASRRPSMTLSIHQGADLPHEALFRDAEAIFGRYEGRPHWGKIHSLQADRLAQLYPEWDRFAAVRKQLDPGGRFVSPYLELVLGV